MLQSIGTVPFHSVLQKKEERTEIYLCHIMKDFKRII